MELISGLVTLCYLLISGIVGLRLIHHSRTDSSSRGLTSLFAKPPELYLGLFFVLYGCIASGMTVAVHASWADPELRLAPTLSRLLLAGFLWIGGIGLTCLLIFIHKTFRPAQKWASWTAMFLSAALFLSALGVGLEDAYAPKVIGGASYWIEFIARDAVFVWICLESLLFWSRLRRRLRLGLADPIVANRFLLIGLWAGSLALLSNSEVLARILYVVSTGEHEYWIPSVGQPILLKSMMATTGLLSLSVASVLLAFFPTSGYRAWLLERHASTKPGLR